MLQLVKDGRAHATIKHEPKELAAFAAEELRRYIYELTGSKLLMDEKSVDSGIEILIGSPHWLTTKGQMDVHLYARIDELKYDGFLIKAVSPNVLLMTSLTERGLLYAVYSLLERAGCRWLYPGS